MNNIEIRINKKSKMVDLSKTFLGNEGESLQGKLIFSFDEFIEGQARLEFEIDGKTDMIFLERVGETYQAPILSKLTKKGQIDMQLVITEGTSEDEVAIFKSNVFYIYCNYSINAESEQPEEYPSWIEIANTKLNQLDNINIEAIRENDKTIITSDDGTYKIIQSSENNTNGSTTNYENMENLPSINNVKLIGNKTLDQLGIQAKGDYALTSAVPTKVSQLANDKSYASESYVTNAIANAQLGGGDTEIDLSGYATKDDLVNKVDKVTGKSLIADSEITRLAGLNNYDDTEIKNTLKTKADTSAIPTKVSQLLNDAGYLTSIPNEYVTETELNAKGYLTEHQDLSSYAKKTDIPTIPTNISSFTNDVGYLTSVPSQYITETELNEAIDNINVETGNVSSDVINSIVVVDELPTIEETGVLYLIKDTGASTEPETPTPEATNLYYQSEPKEYTSNSSGYNLLWGTDCTILFNSTSEMTRDREQLSGDFTLNLVEGKTYKLKAKYISGEMTSSSGTPSFNISLQNSDTSTKYCSVNTNDMADMETTFTATATETISTAKMGVYVYTGTQYSNLVYNITLTEVV